MPKLMFQGHGSLRLTADDGRVVYIDPYKGNGYDLPADIILVTHQHHDHNQIKRCTQKPDCRIITNAEALQNDSNKVELDYCHREFSYMGSFCKIVDNVRRMEM